MRNDITSWELTPNPAQNVLNVQNLGKIEGEVQFEIYSMNGALIQTSTNDFFSNKEALDIENLQSGMYLLQIVTQGQIFTQKFTKN